MSAYSIDINCDVGERMASLENDLFAYITSANVCCGAHAGTPILKKRTILTALRHTVQIGAHPSYPDRLGFGRRQMEMSSEKLQATIREQVKSVQAIAEEAGGKMAYVKPHGALYNKMARDRNEAEIVLRAIREIAPEIAVMGLAGSVVGKVANKCGVPFIAEAFADRRYTSAGLLVSREVNGAVIEDPEQAAEQAVNIAKKSYVVAIDGGRVPIEAQSICIHGDTAGAVDMLKAIHEAFTKHDISIKPFIAP